MIDQSRSNMKTIISSIQRMCDIGYCNHFFSVLGVARDRKRVANLVPISIQRLREISSLSNTEVCSKFLSELGFVPPEDYEPPAEDSENALELVATTIVKVLDLAVVSYSGAHLQDFHEKGLHAALYDDKPIKVTTNLFLRKRSLQCLDGYLGQKQVWTFEAIGSTDPDLAPLYLSTTMTTFADIWGPAWAVKEQAQASESSDHVHDSQKI